ncbi:hypothetical protein ACFHWD_04115 [Clostridium sp. MT-14]|uniref:hypothetical protein n=1 Tax=Clostridium sp. MT-14 TaxID=3348360 RepID=UPI0035F3C933
MPLGVGVSEQLNIKFIYQYSPKWCKYKLNSKNKKGRYDFYFKINNNEYIVETDGGWHNKDNKISGQTKGESKYIDNIKDKLANNHKIEVIRIECNKSELKYIKNNIINKLNNIFNLNKIDWLKCHKYACNSLVKKACDLWQQKDYSTNKIGEILNISDGTIRNYLKQGTKLNWCQYNPKQIQKNNGKLFGNNGTKVICLNNKKIFNSVSEAKRYFKNNVNIINCCKNIAKYAGKDPITGDHLRWMYYDDYLIFKQKSQVINE